MSFTVRPYSTAEADVFQTFDETRVFISPARSEVINSDEWAHTVDLATGLDIEVRRVACGLGCRCAAEVRLAAV